MKNRKDLNVSGIDALFICNMVQFFYDDGIETLSLKIRRNIKDIHTGHFMFLGIVYGECSANRDKLRTQISHN